VLQPNYKFPFWFRENSLYWFFLTHANLIQVALFFSTLFIYFIRISLFNTKENLCRFLGRKSSCILTKKRPQISWNPCGFLHTSMSWIPPYWFPQGESSPHPTSEAHWVATLLKSNRYRCGAYISSCVYCIYSDPSLFPPGEPFVTPDRPNSEAKPLHQYKFRQKKKTKRI